VTVSLNLAFYLAGSLEKTAKFEAFLALVGVITGEKDKFHFNVGADDH
jgi:hypothetical protein